MSQQRLVHVEVPAVIQSVGGQLSPLAVAGCRSKSRSMAWSLTEGRLAMVSLG
jgi:hypothetical protein